MGNTYLFYLVYEIYMKRHRHDSVWHSEKDSIQKKGFFVLIRTKNFQRNRVWHEKKRTIRCMYLDILIPSRIRKCEESGHHDPFSLRFFVFIVSWNNSDAMIEWTRIYNLRYIWCPFVQTRVLSNYTRVPTFPIITTISICMCVCVFIAANPENCNMRFRALTFTHKFRRNFEFNLLLCGFVPPSNYCATNCNYIIPPTLFAIDG